MAEYVTRGGSTVKKHAFESGGNAVKKTVSSSTDFEAADLDMIFLLAPTSTPQRIKRVLRNASGFVYFVSVAGVTGDKVVQTAAIGDLVNSIRAETRLPVGVGFGISTPEAAAEVAAIADAVIVGSKISSIIEAAADPDVAVREVAEFGRLLKDATRRAGA